VDVQRHREAVVGDHRAAAGAEGQRPDQEAQGELDLELAGVDRDVDRSAALDEAEELDLTVDVQQEAGVDRARAERLDAALGSPAPLSDAERRARDGILGRQFTLR
jgi:hypothetical protein